MAAPQKTSSASELSGSPCSPAPAVTGAVAVGSALHSSSVFAPLHPTPQVPASQEATWQQHQQQQRRQQAHPFQHSPSDALTRTQGHVGVSGEQYVHSQPQVPPPDQAEASPSTAASTETTMSPARPSPAAASSTSAAATAAAASAGQVPQPTVTGSYSTSGVLTLHSASAIPAASSASSLASPAPFLPWPPLQTRGGPAAAAHGPSSQGNPQAHPTHAAPTFTAGGPPPAPYPAGLPNAWTASQDPCPQQQQQQPKQPPHQQHQLPYQQQLPPHPQQQQQQQQHQQHMGTPYSAHSHSHVLSPSPWPGPLAQPPPPYLQHPYGTTPPHAPHPLSHAPPHAASHPVSHIAPPSHTLHPYTPLHAHATGPQGMMHNPYAPPPSYPPHPHAYQNDPPPPAPPQLPYPPVPPSGPYSNGYPHPVPSAPPSTLMHGPPSFASAHIVTLPPPPPPPTPPSPWSAVANPLGIYVDVSGRKVWFQDDTERPCMYSLCRRWLKSEADANVLRKRAQQVHLQDHPWMPPGGPTPEEDGYGLLWPARFNPKTRQQAARHAAPDRLQDGSMVGEEATHRSGGEGEGTPKDGREAGGGGGQVHGGADEREDEAGTSARGSAQPISDPTTSMADLHDTTASALETAKARDKEGEEASGDCNSKPAMLNERQDKRHEERGEIDDSVAMEFATKASAEELLEEFVSKCRKVRKRRQEEVKIKLGRQKHRLSQLMPAPTHPSFLQPSPATQAPFPPVVLTNAHHYQQVPHVSQQYAHLRGPSHEHMVEPHHQYAHWPAGQMRAV